MRRVISIFLCLILCLVPLYGCGAGNAPGGDSVKPHIVATIFPAYDWTMQVLGELAQDADVTLLLDNGVDLHSYQPSAEDMIAIKTCDLLIYVGGESDEWIDEALAETDNPDMVILNFMDALGDSAKAEEPLEGMEVEDEHEHGEEDEEELDEHVWLSLRLAEKLCLAIADALSLVSPENSASYKQNAEDYAAKLQELDARYTEAVAQGSFDTLLFADRFPFRYMADDYELNCYAAFAGCSAETEASFETVAFLAAKVDELGLHSVLTIEGGTHKLAETVIRSTAAQNQEILTLDSLQSVTAAELSEGISYLSVMEENLTVLSAALK